MSSRLNKVLQIQVYNSHPEGYLEAFANVYMAFAGRVRAREQGVEPDQRSQDCPGIDEAVRGMRFIELAVAASASDTKWHDFESSRT